MLRADNLLIEEIYERRKENYKDLRSLHTIKAIEKRLAEIKRIIATTPQSKQVFSNQRYKKLALESRLLTMKRAIYKSTAPSLALTKWELELGDKYHWQDKETPEVKETEKKRQTLILLHFILGSKNENELRGILNAIDENDQGIATPV